MSAETIAKNKENIISAAMDLIREGGISSVSARMIGSRIGMNSSLIYRYFEDIDEIILFACVHVLQKYTQELSAARRADEEASIELSEKEIYLLSWELFSRHAFTYPEEYHTLFFSKHSSALPSIISEYHALFPHDLHEDDDIILEGMYRTSNLRDRNLVLLIPVLGGIKSEDDIILINDITVSYFSTLLIQLIGNTSNITPEQQTERMLKACRYLIET
jgi:AcrR family transcriptional regulator